MVTLLPISHIRARITFTIGTPIFKNHVDPNLYTITSAHPRLETQIYATSICFEETYYQRKNLSDKFRTRKINEETE